MVSSGLEALRFMARQPYDVVILNMEMAEMDGLEVIRIVRESWPTAEQPYIIALAEHSREYSEEACLRAGADSFMRKPLRAEELEAAISSLKKPNQS